LIDDSGSAPHPSSRPAAGRVFFGCGHGGWSSRAGRYGVAFTVIIARLKNSRELGPSFEAKQEPGA